MGIRDRALLDLKPSKHIHTQHRSTSIYKAIIDQHRKVDSNTLIVGDFNTTLTPTDISSRQKINKETAALNDTLDQMDLIDVFRAFYHKAAEYTFFSSAHGTFSRRDHMLGYKTTLKI